MLAKQCDRCGRFFDSKISNHFVKLTDMTGHVRKGMKSVTRDLCPYCQKECLDWLHNPKEIFNKEVVFDTTNEDNISDLQNEDDEKQ